ncbi:hypothetical protein [Microtetraspora sp. NBRC 13810]|uniref:hypothetical protein n=1 Tax=Microtetraspora sp. NBRC 13810 TaxID=3030990 RepID=UPI0025549348|nr:hypothetical protein [Microtetraspora sp. NBRC 13810]
MAVLVALDVMSLISTSVVAVLVRAQKLLPRRPRSTFRWRSLIGPVIVIAPSLLPGLTPSTM